MLKRIAAVILFLLPLELYAQAGPGSVPYRGVNNWPLIFGSDNTYDIGAAGSQRPRTVYAGTSVITPTLTVSGLTSGRVPVASTGGSFVDFSTLTFSGGTLTATNLTATSGVTAASVTDSGLTSGRVPFASSGGLLADDADLSFATDTLTVTKLAASAGSSAATSIRMTDDNTGFAEVTATNWGWYVNGAESVRLGSAGAVSTLSGINLGPSISSPDVGLSRSAAGVMRLANGASTRGFFGGGAAVASATALPVPAAGLYHVTGTTTITSITSTNIGTGTCITLIFDGALTLTNGSNLVIGTDFVTTANDTWHGCYDGTSWFELSRKAN